MTTGQLTHRTIQTGSSLPNGPHERLSLTKVHKSEGAKSLSRSRPCFPIFRRPGSAPDHNRLRFQKWFGPVSEARVSNTHPSSCSLQEILAICLKSIGLLFLFFVEILPAMWICGRTVADCLEQRWCPECVAALPYDQRTLVSGSSTAHGKDHLGEDRVRQLRYKGFSTNT